MADFVDIAAVSDIPVDSMKEFSVQSKYVLVAHPGDKFYAVQGRCPHMGGVLSAGRLNGTVVTCPRHSSQFDVTDGHVIRWTKWKGLTLALIKFMRPPYPLKTYEVKVINGRIQVKV